MLDKSVRDIVKLRTVEGRRRSGLVIVEGYPEARQALRADVLFEQLYICPELFKDELGEFSHLSPTLISKEEFAQIAFGKRLKGLLAVCRPKPVNFEDLNLRKSPLIVVLEEVEKPGNLGAVMRSCDGAGVDLIIHCEGKTDIFNQHVVRSSIGAVFCIPCVGASREETYAFLKSKDICLVAATANTTQSYYSCDLAQPTAILIGNEHSGLSSFWLKAADESVTIPMNGKGKCLNAAMSASILVYEALRQRENKFSA